MQLQWAATCRHAAGADDFPIILGNSFKAWITTVMKIYVKALGIHFPQEPN
jgi:hypothetical protein